MDYALIVNWLDIALVFAFVFFMFFLWYYFIYFVIATKDPKRLPKATKYTKFAILIPARNESNVIRHILDACLKLDYPREFFEVFVIIEDKDDPTNKITKEYGFKVIVRGSLENRRTKGFALDDAYQSIKKSGEIFDAFLIFDADNVMNSDYLKHMNDVYQAGYQVGVGYRSFTNATKNWVCGCSATLFSFMNQFTSKGRSYLFEKATLTGTGYFLEYFDEQPEKFKTLNKQHVRWLWGFFASRKQFKKQTNVYPVKSKARRFFSLLEYNCSIYPFLILSIVCILTSLASIGLFIASFLDEGADSGWLFAHAFFQFSIQYLIFVFISAFTIAIDNKNLKFTTSQCITICLTYEIFFYSFLKALFTGLFHKNKRSTWDKIEHKGDIIDKQALERDDGKRE